MIIFMAYLGSMAGFASANTLYLILDSDRLNAQEKELATMVQVAVDDFGVFLGFALSLLLAQTQFWYLDDS